jgi:predicted nucleotidyltransferase/biotin operon repressor
MDLLDRPLALFYDATRARVLDVLLSADQPLSGREIARRAELSPTTAARALDGLEAAGIACSRTRGRSHLWTLRDDNEFVTQVRALARVQDDQAGQLIAEALGEEPLSVTLFGSAARGESGAASDVDLLLVAASREQEVLFRRRAFHAARALRRLVGRPVHVVVMDLDQLVKQSGGPFVEDVLADGRALRGATVRELVS